MESIEKFLREIFVFFVSSQLSRKTFDPLEVQTGWDSMALAAAESVSASSIKFEVRREAVHFVPKAAKFVSSLLAMSIVYNFFFNFLLMLNTNCIATSVLLPKV